MLWSMQALLNQEFRYIKSQLQELTPGIIMLCRTTIKVAILFSVIVANHCLAEDAHLHPLEAFSIKYSHHGMMSGESTQQCRNWCNEMVTSENLVTSMMGITQNTNQKTIIVKDKIYNQNLDTGTVTVTENPMYQAMVSAWEEDPDPMAFAQRWLDTLGYKATGSTQSILGESCKDYTSQQLLGSTVCITGDGIMLHLEMSMTGQNMEQTAVEVKRDDPGNEEGYNIPQEAQSVTPASVPNMDMQQVQEMLKNLQVPTQ